MSNILDDLFQWAASKHENELGAIQRINVAITTNEITRSNLVSYAEGPLYYHPRSGQGLLVERASFSSNENDIKQYFSDRRVSAPGQEFDPTRESFPFNPEAIDPLTVSITQPLILLQSSPLRGWSKYLITLQSSKWHMSESFSPQFDASTDIIYGVI